MTGEKSFQDWAVVRERWKMPRWRLFYHAVSATYRRLPLSDSGLEANVRQSIAAVATKHRSQIHAIGIMPDHVDVARAIPPAVPIPKMMQGLKRVAWKRINEFEPAFSDFQWQSEYGILSFAENALPTVTDDVEHQREHHADGTIQPAFEDGGEYFRGNRQSRRDFSPVTTATPVPCSGTERR